MSVWPEPETGLSSDIMTIEVVDIAKVLGGSKVLEQEISLFAELKIAIERGFPAAAARETMEAVVRKGASLQQTDFMVLVFATAERRNETTAGSDWKGLLTPAESERTERIARIFALAAKALGDDETARSFMTTPHDLLSGDTPLKYLSNEVGALEVEQILNAMLYGLPA